MVVRSVQCVDNSLSSNEGAEEKLKLDSPTEKRGKGKTVTENGKKSTVNREPESGRRTSSRIQMKLKEEKERLVRGRVELLDGEENQGKNKKRCAANNKKSKANEMEEEQKPVVEEKDLKTEDMVEEEKKEDVLEGDENGTVSNSVEKSAHVKVKETLRLFNKHYLYFVKLEEERCRKVEIDMKATKGSKSKKTKPPEGDVQKQQAKRPDLKAISKMKVTNEILYPEKRIGDLPGIEVGHQFYSRAEMVAVGFHSHWLNGIDYLGQSYRKGEYSNHTFPLAVAIVLSGMYEDDLDNAEAIVYTGQGGHNLTGNKRQIQDQVMERGNLALKNCVDEKVPVRVVRGHESSSSYSGKVYTYDGLYNVVQYWAEKGLSGFTVFKYRLLRLEGQPIMTTNQVQFTYGRVPQSISEIRGLVCEDITGGLEDVPIPATNLVDDPPVAPSGYTYCKSIKIGPNVKIPTISGGCNCKGSCMDSKSCACAKLNGSDFPYVQRDGGRLIEAKDVIYECGPKCGCGPGCVNRTSQRGIRYRLEVYRTPKKGWAVRSWDFIPSGAPVCEYIGVLNMTEDLDHVSENNFIFDIDCLQTMNGLGGRERRQKNLSDPLIVNADKPDDQKAESAPEFCIDAGSTGNVARFINHSCEPNLFVQCVLSSHHDLQLARVMLFAADNIPPLQELTYDYGYALDSVLGPDGKIMQMACYCGASECRKRLF